MARKLRGIAADGTKYVVHYDREWREWQVRAYRKNKSGVWKYHDGRTYFSEDKEDAIQTFWHLVGHGPAGTHVNPGVYRVQAHGFGLGPYFANKTEAKATIAGFVREDVRACRRKFGEAYVERRGDKFWEVRPTRYPAPGAPIWSRYTLTEV